MNENNHKVFIARGLKLFLNLHFTYDHVVFSVAIVIACTVMDYACYTISKQVKLVMTTFAKVRKLSLVIKVSTHHKMWQEKGGKYFLINVFHFSKR